MMRLTKLGLRHTDVHGNPRMNVHKNARLTPRGQVLMVSRVINEGWSVVASAEAVWVFFYLRASPQREIAAEATKFFRG